MKKPMKKVKTNEKTNKQTNEQFNKKNQRINERWVFRNGKMRNGSWRFSSKNQTPGKNFKHLTGKNWQIRRIGIFYESTKA